MDVNDKVAIVTGGVGDIGFATVQCLLQSGIDFVAIFDLYKAEDEFVHKKLEELQKKYKNETYGYYTCDVKNVSEFTDCYEKVLAHKSYVDILINNAAVGVEINIDLMIDVNFKAVVHGTMVAIERMGKHKNHRGGVVVNIGSTMAFENIPMIPLYCATKHAVVSFVRSMKEHNKTLGVRIVSLCPGATKTSLSKRENFNVNVFEFVTEENRDILSLVNYQSPDSVASAIIEIIKRGKEGDVWMACDDAPPFNVGEETNIDKLRIPF